MAASASSDAVSAPYTSWRSYRFSPYEGKEEGEEVGLLILEGEAGGTLGPGFFGTFLWPSGELLAWYLWMNPDVVRGQVVIELGAGVGLPGLLAARLGAKRVSITDRADGVAALANVAAAVRANELSSTCDVFPLTWGHFEELQGDAAHGIILGSDLFFSSEHLDSILATVHWLFHWRAPPSAPRRFYVTYQERSPNRSIRTLLPKWGLVARAQQLDFLPDYLAQEARFSSLHLLILEMAPVQSDIEDGDVNDGSCQLEYAAPSTQSDAADLTACGQGPY